MELFINNQSCIIARRKGENIERPIIVQKIYYATCALSRLSARQRRRDSILRVLPAYFHTTEYNPDLFSFPTNSLPSPPFFPLAPLDCLLWNRRADKRYWMVGDRQTTHLRRDTRRRSSIDCPIERNARVVEMSWRQDEDGVRERAYEAAWDSRSKRNLPHLGGEACDSRFSILEGAHTCSPSFPFVPLRHRDLLHRGPQTSLAHRQVHISRGSRTLAVKSVIARVPFRVSFLSLLSI